MSDPYYDQSRMDPSRQDRNDLPPEAASEETGAWALGALLMLLLMALTWFSFAPLQNTHETAANRAPLTEVETSGRSDRTSPQIPRE
jgi:hypothetical protein